MSESEYEAATTRCGLVDVYGRGKLALSGTEAAAFLQGQVSNDVEGLSPGAGCYAALLTPKGKMLADLRILRTDDELLLDTERSALQELFNALRRTMIGYDAELHKRTLERGMLKLVGPRAAEMAHATELDQAQEHTHCLVAIAGVEARAIRTDLGIDLLCDAAATAQLHSSLLASGASAIEEGTLECLRVERGPPRYGIELDDTVIPQEAGLNERAVSFTKGCYVGQETVARLHYRGKPNRHLRGLRLSAPERTGAVLRHAEREVGRLGTAVLSPRFGPIGLALIRREVAPGSRVAVGEDSTRAEVVELPFT